jgi:serine/threonine protein kinase
LPRNLPRDLEGGFQLHALIGEGGMGRVYRGIQTLLERPVAVKMIKPNPKEEKLLTARFMREAKVVAAIDHPNVVRVLHFGRTQDHELFLVMEYLEGISLDALMAREVRLGVRRTVHIAQQICSAMGAAHRQGVVHRDLKPANVMLVEKDGDVDFVKVLDFGVAKVIGDVNSVTQAGYAVGTYDYMAPEQIMAKAVDGRCDIYALGVLLYKVLSGRRPFGGSDEISLAHKHLKRMPDPLRAHFPEGALPPALEDLVQKCLAKKPEDRFPDMEALRTALKNAVPEDFEETPPSRAPAQLKDTRAVVPPILDGSDDSDAVTADAHTSETHDLPTETGFGAGIADEISEDDVPTRAQVEKGLLSDPPTGPSTSQEGPPEPEPDPETKAVQGADVPEIPEAPTQVEVPAIQAHDDRTETQADHEIAKLNEDNPGGQAGHDNAPQEATVNSRSSPDKIAHDPNEKEEDGEDGEDGAVARSAPSLSEPIDHFRQPDEGGYFGRILIVLAVVGLVGLAGALIFKGASGAVTKTEEKTAITESEKAKPEPEKAKETKAEAEKPMAETVEEKTTAKANPESEQPKAPTAEELAKKQKEAARKKAEEEKWAKIKAKRKARGAKKK